MVRERLGDQHWADCMKVALVTGTLLAQQLTSEEETEEEDGEEASED